MISHYGNVISMVSPHHKISTIADTNTDCFLILHMYIIYIHVLVLTDCGIMWMGVSDDIGHFKACLKICLVSSLESSFPHSLPCLTGFFCKDKTSLCVFLSNFRALVVMWLERWLINFHLFYYYTTTSVYKRLISYYGGCGDFFLPKTAKSDLAFSKSTECLTPSAVWCVKDMHRPSCPPVML